MKILGLIPARGGSKGIPRKNLAMLGGKPLIQWTIEAAIESRAFPVIAISSDDYEIFESCVGWMDKNRDKLGKPASVLLVDRPNDLGDDVSPVIDTVFHAIKYFADKTVEFDAVFLLQPTNPLRTAEDIRQACAMLEQGAQSVVSYSPVGEMNPERMRWNNYGQLYTVLEGQGLSDPPMRRQEFAECVIRDGSVYLATVEHIQKRRSFESNETEILIIPRDRSVRIDEPFDLEYAEFLLTRQQKLVSNT